MRKLPETNIDIEFEQLEVDRRSFDVTAKVRGTWADQGIGPYEFWGKVGFDSHIDLDEIFVEVDEEVVEILDDGETKTFKADQELIDKITDKIYETKDDYMYDELHKEADSYGEDEDER